MARSFPALWLAGFSAGLLAAEAGLPVGGSFVLGTHLAAALLVTGARGSDGGGVLLLAATAGVLSLGGPLAVAERDRPARAIEATLEAEIAGARRVGGSTVLLLERVRGIDRRPIPRRLQLWIDRPGEQGGGLADLPRGCRLRARVRIAPIPARRNPGSPDPAHRAEREGRSARGSLVHPRFHAIAAEGCEPTRWQRYRAAARSRLLAAGPGGGLLAALALGERGAVDPHRRAGIASLGLSHLLAVSGLHLALVATLAFGGARRLATHLPGLRLDGRRVGLLAALGLGAGYALFTGLGVPVQRAALLLGALALGVVRRHPVAPVRALVLAAGLVLLLDPTALFAPGAQLSFAATAGLVLARRREAASLPSFWLDLARVSATALLATAPLAAVHFGQTTPLGLVTNLVAVPATGMVLLPLALATALLAPWSGSAALVELAAGLAGLLLDGALGLAAWLPVVAPRRPGLASLVASLVVMGWALRKPGTRPRVLGALAVCAVLGFGPGSEWRPARPRLVVFDVGQGDAILVQTAEHAVLVDAGGAFRSGGDRGRQVVVPALAALGVRRLDLVVATLADLDHRGGLPSVLRAVPCERVWVPYGGLADPAFASLREVAASRGVLVVERGRRAAPARWPDLAVVPLWPPPGSAPPSRNAGSLVLRIDVGGRRVLLPGDLPRAQEAEMMEGGRTDLAADVLLLGHHGSRTSTGAGFLDAVAPELAIVSAPRLSVFGMPHREVRERLRARGIPLAWTGRDGAVAVALAGSTPRPELLRREWLPLPGLSRRRPAVDRPDRAMDVGDVFGGQQREDLRDLFRRAAPAERGIALDQLSVRTLWDLEAHVHGGVHATGRDGVDADVLAHVLHGQGAHEVRDGALRGRVGGGVGLAAEGGDRGDGDDVALALPETRNGRLAHVEDAVDVDALQQVPVRLRHLVEVGEAVHARDVAEHVEPTKALDHRVDRGEASLSGADVADASCELPSCRLHGIPGLCQADLVDVEPHDLGSLGREAQRRRTPDPRRGPREKGHLAFETTHRHLLHPHLHPKRAGGKGAKGRSDQGGWSRGRFEGLSYPRAP